MTSFDLPCAISPCPNDTFSFYAWLHQKIDTPLEIAAKFYDIEQLNELALAQAFPLIKVSYALLPHIQDHYLLLKAGSALGKGCGPKLISKKRHALEELPALRVGIPGRYTSAHLLLNTLLEPPAHKVFLKYNEMLTALEQDRIDAALIIHETRFTFKEAGFFEMADLGELWEKKTAQPIPLGAVVLHRDYRQYESLINQSLAASISWGFSNFKTCLPFVKKQAQELSEEVIEQHIRLYVNEESLNLSQKALAAIEALTRNEDEKPCHLCH